MAIWERSARKPGRGSLQLGTLGGGNHFELQVVREVYDQEGEAFWLFPVFDRDDSYRRGFDTRFVRISVSLLPAARKYGIEVPDRGLACAPVESREGLEYYAAMACAISFAFANRS